MPSNTPTPCLSSISCFQFSSIYIYICIYMWVYIYVCVCIYIYLQCFMEPHSKQALEEGWNLGLGTPSWVRQGLFSHLHPFSCWSRGICSIHIQLLSPFTDSFQHYAGNNESQMKGLEKAKESSCTGSSARPVGRHAVLCLHLWLVESQGHTVIPVNVWAPTIAALMFVSK